MKSTHNKLRALSKGLALAVCLVTGTAAMMTAFSAVTPSASPDRLFISTAAAPQAVQTGQANDDSVLYQRVTQADGSQQWVLLTEPQAIAFAPASRTLLMAESRASDGLKRVSYTLEAKPAGWNRVLKNCSQVEAGKPLGAAPAYDIACARLG